jgi:2-polyprenyl-3-methyl-5-hydroxy-6-metoxy-1,4-benzoquinol methylase
MSQPVRPLPEDKEGEFDIPALMAQIRERIKLDVEKNRDKHTAITPVSARFSDDKARNAGDLQHSEDLRFLNLNYAYETKVSPNGVVTHRSGLLGKIIVKLKRKFISFLRNAFLSDYLAAERSFNEHLVRYLNEVGRYTDARDTHLFVELIRKIDTDVGRVRDALTRIDDEKSAAIFALGNQSEAASKDLINRIGLVDTMVRGLEGIVANLPSYRDAAPPIASVQDGGAPAGELSYLLLENRYRGGEDEIGRRISIYPEIFKGSPGRVLEIGSGRGELQRLFKQHGIDSYGVDLDVVMVNVANANGCQTQYGDGIAHLRSLEDRSLGGVIAVQVVEHLTRDQLKELCDLAKRKVKQGGTIVFETINPQSVLALSSNYFRDPTHVWPMHPDTLGYIATLSGLKVVETRYLSPVATSHLLKEVPVDSTYSAPLGDAMQRLNANIRQLNSLLYGFQDYCLILEVV